MNNRIKRMFNIAREMSYMSDFNGPHVGAVVAIGKTVISTGCNSFKTNPLQHRYNIYRGFESYQTSIPSQHAEVGALSHLIGKEINWKDVSIYIYRETKDGKPACSKPCTACARLIKDLGISRVYYIDCSGRYIKERFV